MANPKPEQLTQIDYRPPGKDWMDPAVEFRKGVFCYSAAAKNLQYLGLPNPREWQPFDKTSLKAALLDQRLVAGLGNIYVCEALHRALLSPKRMASTIAGRKGEPNERAGRLVESIKAALNEAIKAGGSSLRDHRLTDGDLGMFQHHFRVYDREGEPCPTPGCGGTVKRIVQNGRSTFYCPVCQK